jgi:hypothetical protein
MKRRYRAISILLLLALTRLLPAAHNKTHNPLHHLSATNKARLIKLLYDFQPFLKTAVDVHYPDTLNLFFTDKIYRRLKGNPFVGYLFDEGVTIRSNRFCLNIDAPPAFKKYTAIFRDLLEKTTSPVYRLDFSAPSPGCTLHLFIVDINPEKSRGLIPSITLEMALKDNTQNRAFFIRFSTGHADGLFEAMQLAVKRIVINLRYLTKKASP